MNKVQLVHFCQFSINMSIFLGFNTYLLLLCSDICLNLRRILTVSLCFSQYHDVQLKLCGGGRWELTKLKGGSGSLSLREEATWLQSSLWNPRHAGTISVGDENRKHSWIPQLLTLKCSSTRYFITQFLQRRWPTLHTQFLYIYAYIHVYWRFWTFFTSLLG